MVRQAKAMGMVIPPRPFCAASPNEPLKSPSDFMADVVGGMLNAVLTQAVKRNRLKPIDAPWMPAVLAAGASAKIVDLMGPFASQITDEMQRQDPAANAYDFFSRCSSGTGASNPTSKPSKAAKAPKTDGADDGSGLTAQARTQGICIECNARVSRLKWCGGCHLAGYCGAKCQKIAWRAHKKSCSPYTKWESFVKHVMSVQTEPFLTGPWAGRMPADVMAMSSTPDIPCYSKRQLSLREYIMMLSASEKKFTSTAERRAATDGVDGISVHGVVTWMRAGVVAAVYAYGPKLRLCDRAMRDECNIVWRQTMGARTCQNYSCQKQVATIAGRAGLQMAMPSIGPPTTPIWLRRVAPDPKTNEPRIHLLELESCSDKCKRVILTFLAQEPTVSKNDFIDSDDALRKKYDPNSGPRPVSVDI